MVDPDRVKTKLGQLEEYIKGLVAKQDCSRDEYLSDRDRQDIVERRFEKAAQASIDIASHIVSTEGFREPTDYGDLFEILSEEDILSEGLATQMIEMAGFRNALAHEYASIVDDRVYDHLQDLDRFRRYAEEIHRFAEGNQSTGGQNG